MAKPKQVSERGGRAGSPAATGVGSATLRSPKQVRALIAPARQEIADVLDAAGPCSVAALAELVGRPADGLYHHLRALVRVGVVAQVERRKEGRHVFTVYDLAVRPLRMSYAQPVRRADVLKVVAAAQRLAWRDFRRAFAAGGAVEEGPERALWGARAKGWADAKRLTRINRLLEELLATVRGGAPASGAIPISVGFLSSPAPSARRTKRNVSQNARGSRAAVHRSGASRSARGSRASAAARGTQTVESAAPAAQRRVRKKAKS